MELIKWSIYKIQSEMGGYFNVQFLGKIKEGRAKLRIINTQYPDWNGRIRWVQKHDITKAGQ